MELTVAADGFVARRPGNPEATWLNRTAALVLHLCTGRSTVDQIAAAVIEAYDVSAPVVPEIERCLNDLAVAELIDMGPVTTSGGVLVVIVSDSGSVSAQTMHALHDWRSRATDAGFPVEVIVTPGPDHLAYNRAATRVVGDDRFAHLMLLGPDVVLDVAAWERLRDSQLDVVGLPQPNHRERWQYVRDAAAGLPDLDPADVAATAGSYAVTVVPGSGTAIVRDGFLRCDAVGTTCLMVSRTALQRLAASAVTDRYQRQVTIAGAIGSTGWGFFDPAITPAADAIDAATAFCARWRATGGEVWADLSGEYGRSIDVARRLVGRR